MSTDRSKAINAYLARVSRARKRGDATEVTHPETLRLMSAIDKAIPNWPIE